MNTLFGGQFFPQNTDQYQSNAPILNQQVLLNKLTHKSDVYLVSIHYNWDKSEYVMVFAQIILILAGVLTFWLYPIFSIFVINSLCLMGLNLIEMLDIGPNIWACMFMKCQTEG